MLSKTSQTSKDKYCPFSSPRLKQFFFFKKEIQAEGEKLGKKKRTRGNRKGVNEREN